MRRKASMIPLQRRICERMTSRLRSRPAPPLLPSAGVPAGLRLAGILSAGGIPSRMPGEAGTCLQIATGAVVPEGADAVVPVEETRREDGRILFTSPARAGQHTIGRGEDAARGDPLLRAGEVLTSGRIGAAAAAGIPAIEVFRRPSVFLLTTGDELVGTGSPIAPHQVYESNGAVLSALARACGCAVSGSARAPDDLDAIRRAVEASGWPDFLPFTGGSSVGERDFTLDAITTLGKLQFRGIRVKPGKPALFGRVGPDLRTRVFGLPGYPASCHLVAHALAAPAFRKAAGFPDPRPFRARLAAALSSLKGRTDFVPVRVADGVAHSTFRGSHAVTSVSAADGWLTIPEPVERLEAGQEVEIRPVD